MGPKFDEPSQDETLACRDDIRALGVRPHAKSWPTVAGEMVTWWNRLGIAVDIR